MRKILILLFLILVVTTYSQTTGSYWRVTTKYTLFNQNLPDSTIILEKDSAKFYQIAHIGGVLGTQNMAYAWSQGWVRRIPKDLLGYNISSSSLVFQYEFPNDAINNIPVSFTLTSTTIVFYNGAIIPNTKWSGVGTTTLNVSLDTRKYDKLLIKM